MSEPIKQLDEAGLTHLWEKIVNRDMVFSNTTAGWNSQPTLKAKEGAMYIYTDYRYNDDNKPLAALKIGDGTSYLVDMPFIDELIWDHINNNDIHITAAERIFWNNKVRCFIDASADQESLIFTTN